MASTNQTTKYKLSQWVEDDPVLREDFNEDNRKIETAIKAVEDAQKAFKIFPGTYTGTGASVRTITPGFFCRAVLVFPCNKNGGTIMPELAVVMEPGGSLSVEGTSFTVRGNLNLDPKSGTLGEKANPYSYLLFL